MGVIWWILPAIVGVLALMLIFAALGKFSKRKPLAGLTRLVFGTAFFGLAGALVFASLNLQTYKRLTLERDVATVKFVEVDGEPGAYRVDLTYAGGEKLLQQNGDMPVLKGDQFSIGAQVIKFTPMANMMGYDSIYRLDFIEGRQSRRFNTERVTEAVSNGIALTDNPGVDVHVLAAEQGGRFGIDAQYGSATYQPMAHGFEFNVAITQDAIVARPTAATKIKMGLEDYPGNAAFVSGKRK